MRKKSPGFPAKKRGGNCIFSPWVILEDDLIQVGRSHTVLFWHVLQFTISICDVYVKFLKIDFVNSFFFLPNIYENTHLTYFSRIFLASVCTLYFSIYSDAKGGKKLLMWKIWVLSFILHKKSSKKVKNSQKSNFLKFDKFSKNRFSEHFFEKKSIFRFFLNFQRNRFSRVLNIF